jgi:hypothetical protein
MTRCNWIVDRGCLRPADDEAREVLAKFKQGKELSLPIKGNRNPAFHRLAMKCFSLIAESLDIPSDALREWVKQETYEFEPDVVMKDGSVIRRTRSHAYESMDQVHFSRHMDRAVHAIFTKLLPGPEWNELRDEVVRIYEGQMPERRAA